MKRILLVLFVLVSVSSVFAADLKVSGDFYMRGSTYDNLTLAEEDEPGYSDFDYDLNMDLALVANENAKVMVRLTYDKAVSGAGYEPMGSASATDKGLAVERAYLSYKLHPALTVDAGLMGGGTWGTTFNNNENNITRVKLVGGLSPEMVFLAIYEKGAEMGAASSGVYDSEKNDTTTYYLASVMKFGTLTVMPLIVYGTTGVNYENASSADDRDKVTTAYQLALKGDFGMVAFEAEADYKKVDLDLPATDDEVQYGYYANVWVNVAPAKIGLMYAYGSADEDTGVKFAFGDDFDCLTVMDDFITNGGTAGLKGYSVYKLYADITMDKLTVSLAAAYGASNADYEVNKDSSFMEYDAGIAYALDANTTYTLAGGYASTTDFNAVDTDAAAYRVYHKLAIKF